ncbi:MAG: hypothetical protein ISQ14_11420, partial [Verrucomicrobiae bacterium]|nr:hypothetical protein [Verrucomicrobiae bacterium]
MLLLVVFKVPGVAAVADRSVPLTSAAVINRLSGPEASKGLPVRVEGVVVQRWSGRQLLFMEADGRVLEVYAPGTNHLVGIGQTIEVEGLSMDQAGPQVVARSLTVLDAEYRRPNPQETAVSEIGESIAEPRWIQIDGVVRQAQWSSERLWLEVRDRGHLLQVNIPKAPKTDLHRLVFSRVRVSGVLTTWSRMSIERPGPVLWLGSADDLEIVSQHSDHLFDKIKVLPVRS